MANLDKDTPHFYMYQMRSPRVHNPTQYILLNTAIQINLYHGGPTENPTLPQASSRPELREEFKRSRAGSQLSNFGSSILQLKDTDIYNKQKQRMDIISMQPVWTDETIKKYPKFTLEDKDAYYYRRMAPKVGEHLPEKVSGSRFEKTPVPQNDDKLINGGQRYNNHKGKMELDLWQSYEGKQPVAKKFRPKMLSHADQFRSLM